VRAATELERREGTVRVTQFEGICTKLEIRFVATSSPQGQVSRVEYVE